MEEQLKKQNAEMLDQEAKGQIEEARPRIHELFGGPVDGMPPDAFAKYREWVSRVILAGAQAVKKEEPGQKSNETAHGGEAAGEKSSDGPGASKRKAKPSNNV